MLYLSMQSKRIFTIHGKRWKQKGKKTGIKDLQKRWKMYIYIYRIKIYARISLYSQKMHYNARSLLHKSVQVDRRRGDSKLSYRLRPRRGLCRDRVSIQVKVSLCAHFLTHHDFWTRDQKWENWQQPDQRTKSIRHGWENMSGVLSET